MTDTEIREAIAMACGWRGMEADESQDGFRDEDGVWHAVPPDYPNDLNAMHEVEKSADKEFYAAQLLAVIHQVDEDYFNKVSWENAYELATATARQRSEAFLKTLGLWKDEFQFHCRSCAGRGNRGCEGVRIASKFYRSA